MFFLLGGFYNHVFCALIDRPLVDRATKSSNNEVDPFLGAVRVISIGSCARTLLLNKKTMFPLKEQKLLGALKLLLFKV